VWFAIHDYINPTGDTTMKSLAYATAVVALVASSSFALAQNATAPATQPAADCPAPGSVPEAQMPANCKTNMNQNNTAAGTTATTAPMQGMDPAKSFLASNFIGQTVYSATNENVGEINDLVMDKDKGMVVAIVGVGGFLGIGEKDVAMPLDQIQAMKTDNNTIRLTINATKQQLEAAPAFDRNMLAVNPGTKMAPGAGTTTGTTNGTGTTAQ
jgi:sporulation protein YlmC with PRC-barrel domain